MDGRHDEGSGHSAQRRLRRQAHARRANRSLRDEWPALEVRAPAQRRPLVHTRLWRSPRIQGGDLPAVQVIELLRAKYFGWETAVAEEAPAVAEEASAVADPMNDLDDVLEEKPIETKKPKINRKKRLQ